jgi:hypothetical protein
VFLTSGIACAEDDLIVGHDGHDYQQKYQGQMGESFLRCLFHAASYSAVPLVELSSVALVEAPLVASINFTSAAR